MHLQYGSTETCHSWVNFVSHRCKCIQLVLKWKQWFQHILQSLVLRGSDASGSRQTDISHSGRKGEVWSLVPHRRGYVDEDRKLNFMQFAPIFTAVSVAVWDILLVAVMMWGCLLRLQLWCCLLLEQSWVNIHEHFFTLYIQYFILNHKFSGVKHG
jgi:hypothetical protein